MMLELPLSSDSGSAVILISNKICFLLLAVEFSLTQQKRKNEIKECLDDLTL